MSLGKLTQLSEHFMSRHDAHGTEICQWSLWCWRSSESMLLNVLIVIKLMPLQRLVLWSKEVKFAWR